MVSSRPQNHRSSGSIGSGNAASAILGAFGRRPKTATNNSSTRLGQATDYAESTEDLTPSSHSTSRNRISIAGRAGLPRSSSSSNVNRVSSNDGSAGNTERGSRFAFPSSPSFLNDSRRPTNTANQASSASLSNSGSRSGDDAINRSFHNINAAINRSDSSQVAPPGVSAIGRYLRRYSQGAGKTMMASNGEAVATNASNNAQSGTSSTGNNNTTNRQFVNYQTGSALTTSRTMPVLPMPNITGSPIQSTRELADLEGAIAASIIMLNGSTDSASATANPTSMSGLVTSTSTDSDSMTHRIRLVPHLEATRSLHFEPIERDLVEGAIAVKIGRFTDRAQASASGAANGNGPDADIPTTPSGGHNSIPLTGITTSGSSMGVPGARGGAIPSSAGGGGRVDSARIAFKSKVVSRGHAEIWCEANGKFFIRDTKSSSGTFLNHIRLSHPNLESKPFPVKDGDVVQLGVDYQGGTEEIYRCVKMRVELNRGWQRGANQFNVNALRQLRALQGAPLPEPGAAGSTTTKAPSSALPTNRQSMNVTDCCICLFSVTVCQALFIAPCSHVYHFKCIRPLIEQHHPGFSCPLCRTFADLNADVEEDEAWQQALLQEAQYVPNLTSPPDVTTPMVEDPPMVTPQSSAAQGGAENTNSANYFPRNPSSLGRAVENMNLDPSTETPRRRGDSSLLLQRPDTAVSITAAPPFSTNQYPGHSLRNVITSNHTNEERDEDQEIMHEEQQEEADFLPATMVQNRLPSAPISIQAISQQPSADGFIASPGYLDARTPLNEHFLSTLAEGPPPSRYSLRAMDSAIDNTLYPNMLRADIIMERRVSSATNNSSQPGTNDAFTTPAQGNSPPGGGSSPMSVTARSQNFDEDGNGDSNGSSSLAHHHQNQQNLKGKSTDKTTITGSAKMQGAIDFLANGGGDQSVTTSNNGSTNSSNRRQRRASLVGSVDSTDRGSSLNSGQEIGTPSKVARFFKRNSSAIGN